MTTTMAPVNGGSRITANEPGRLMEYVPFGQRDKIKLSVKIVQDLIATKTKQGHSCSDTEAIKFMMLCQSRGLNPFEGDAYLIGYDGKDGPTFSLITAHQAFLKRAENNPEYDGMQSGVIVKREVADPESGELHAEIVDVDGDFFIEGDTVLGGWATVYFKNRKYPMKKRLRLAAFSKDYGVWKTNPAGMIVKCAEADALRSSFPTLLGGLYAAEELSPPVSIEIPAVEPAKGRQRIAGTRKPAEEQPAPVTPTNNTTFAADGAEPAAAQAVEPESVKDQVLNFLDAIEQTTTKAGLTKIGSELKTAEKTLGTDGHKEVMDAWRKKYQALSEAK